MAKFLIRTLHRFTAIPLIGHSHQTTTTATTSFHHHRRRPRRRPAHPFQATRCHTTHAATATTTSALPPSLHLEDSEAPHVPVLLEEILGFYQDLNVRVYVDGTLGAGGHASHFLRCHSELETLVGFDLDPAAHAIAGARLQQHGAHVVPVSLSENGLPVVSLSETGTTAPPSSSSSSTDQLPPKAYLVRSNFSSMSDVLIHLPTTESLHGSVDAMLLDLGVSSMQIDVSERGFSFMRDGPLDMRMDPGATVSAEVAVNTWSEAQLGTIIKDFGEERYWKSIARRIVSAREEAPICTTQQLVKAIGYPGGGGGGGGGRRSKEKKHPATRTFQALRIAVNGELQSIAATIPAAVSCLAPGGRLSVITFHSLEDRIVKWAFRQAAGMAPTDEPLPSYCAPFDGMASEAMVKILTRRPVVPGDAEQDENPRSRSAKLRVVERLDT